MRAMSLSQPYAGLVRLGLKMIETRTRRTSHRGDLAICAAKSVMDEAYTKLRKRLVPHVVSEEDFDAACGLRGYVVAVARVVDCRPLMVNDEPHALFWAHDRWAWVLEGIRPVTPRPVRGAVHMFDVPDDMIVIEVPQ